MTNELSFSLDEVRVFLAVLDEGGFARAGKRVGRVQSAVSQAVSRLEENLGVALFQRQGRRSVMTEQARVLLPELRALVEQAARVAERASLLHDEVEPLVSIAYDPVFPIACLTTALQDVMATFPNCTLRVEAASLGAAALKVRAGEVALAITGPEANLAGLEPTPLLAVEMLPCAAPGHPLAKALSPARLESATQILLRDPSGETGDRLFGVHSERRWTVDDWSTKLTLIKSGLGWGRLPRHLARDALATGQLVELPLGTLGVSPIVLDVSVVRRRDRPLGTTARALIERLTSESKSLVSELEL